MFYYLLNHSSLLNKQNEKAKNLSIILFGSLIYLSIHAFLSFNKNTTIQKVKPYFWFMFLLDIIMSYYSFIYKSKQDKNNDNKSLDNKKDHNFMEEIFSIKNKITEMISSNKNNNNNNTNNNNNNNNDNNNNDNNNNDNDNNEDTSSKQKTDLQKEKDALILQLKEELTNSKNHNKSHNSNNNSKEDLQLIENIEQPTLIQNNKEIMKEDTISSTKKMSTPIKNLIKKKTNIQQKHINHPLDNSIKEAINQQEEEINNTNKKEPDFNDSASESGSEMDFDISEFQNTLDE